VVHRQQRAGTTIALCFTSSPNNNTSAPFILVDTDPVEVKQDRIKETVATKRTDEFAETAIETLK